MSRLIEHLLKQRILTLFGNDFQQFVEKLYLLNYGTDFTPIIQKRDKGCDGFINGDRIVIAVYAPEKRDLRRFKTKVGDDYRKYREHWEPMYPNWQLVYNNVFTAEELQFIESLKPSAIKISVEHLLDIYKRLSWTHKRDISNYLGMDDQFFRDDILGSIVDDLIKGSTDNEDFSQDKPIYIEDKIKLNFEHERVESAKDEYHDALLYFGELKKLLFSYTDREQLALKSKIRRDYGKYSGSFSVRLDALTKEYSVQHGNDDLYIFHVRVFLLYYFEQCLIGQKTEFEKNDYTSLRE